MARLAPRYTAKTQHYPLFAGLESRSQRFPPLPSPFIDRYRLTATPKRLLRTCNPPKSSFRCFQSAYGPLTAQPALSTHQKQRSFEVYQDIENCRGTEWRSRARREGFGFLTGQKCFSKAVLPRENGFSNQNGIPPPSVKLELIFHFDIFKFWRKILWKYCENSNLKFWQ